MVEENAPNQEVTRSAIHVRNATKMFGKQAAVSDLSFDVPLGKIIGLIGPSGCGKTTTVRLMTGIYKPTSGEILVFGEDPRSFTAIQRGLIGYMTQHFALYPDLSVTENMNFAASIYGEGLFSRRKRIQGLLEFVELQNSSGKLARNISGGMQRRLALASTMIHDPELFFLDEPTAGIDPILRRKFWDQFIELRDAGKTMIITTQYVNEAAYCDLVGIMADGKLILMDTPEGLRQRAFGGDMIDLKTKHALPSQTILEIEAMEFCQSGFQTIPGGKLRLTVADAGAAIPDLMQWLHARDVEVETLEEYLPPYDDVFVKVVEDYNASAQALVDLEAKDGE